MKKKKLKKKMVKLPHKCKRWMIRRKRKKMRKRMRPGRRVIIPLMLDDDVVAFKLQ